jgi:hypothetical protein
MRIEPEFALRALLRAMKTPRGVPEYPAGPVGRFNDSEAAELRTLLRLPPMLFYGELELHASKKRTVRDKRKPISHQ